MQFEADLQASYIHIEGLVCVCTCFPVATVEWLSWCQQGQRWQWWWWWWQLLGSSGAPLWHHSSFPCHDQLLTKLGNKMQKKEPIFVSRSLTHEPSHRSDWVLQFKLCEPCELEALGRPSHPSWVSPCGLQRRRKALSGVSQIYQSDRSLHMEGHILAKNSFREASWDPRTLLSPQLHYVSSSLQPRVGVTSSAVEMKTWGERKVRRLTRGRTASKW